jgi:hypothetical protein
MTGTDDALSTAGTIIAGVGALFLLIGLVLIGRAAAFLRGAIATEGTVVDLEESRDIDTGSIRYAPVVKFTTAEGQTTQFTDPSGTSPNPYEIGETVPVKYDPSKPHKARIPTALRLWVAPAILVVLGGGLLVGGLVLKQQGG